MAASALLFVGMHVVFDCVRWDNGRTIRTLLCLNTTDGQAAQVHVRLSNPVSVAYHEITGVQSGVNIRVGGRNRVRAQARVRPTLRGSVRDNVIVRRENVYSGLYFV